MSNTAQTSPIFTKNSDIQTGVTISAANTAKDGTGTVVTVFAADRSVTSITQAGGVATVTFPKPHNFLNGEEVMFQGANESAYNGIKSVTVISPLKVTYSINSSTASPATGTILASPINGTRVSNIVYQPLGTNIVTVARVFLNNGQDNTTAANNTYLKDVTLPATTLDEDGTMPQVVMPLDIVIPPYHKINTVLGTAVAAGYAVWAETGNY